MNILATAAYPMAKARGLRGGKIRSETGRRSSRGQVEIFSWEGYKSMPTEEYEAWREIVEAA